MSRRDEQLEKHDELLKQLKLAMPELEQLLEDVSSEWGYEDVVYRFYHQSYKISRAQEKTRTIVNALAKVMPGQPLNKWFMDIVTAGTGHEFTSDDNYRWVEVYCPVIEAFFHARFFLEMAVKYGQELEVAPEVLPSGWAALLYLYDMR